MLQMPLQGIILKMKNYEVAPRQYFREA